MRTRFTLALSEADTDYSRTYRGEPEPDVPGAAALDPGHPQEEVQPESAALELAPHRAFPFSHLVSMICSRTRWGNRTRTSASSSERQPREAMNTRILESYFELVSVLNSCSCPRLSISLACMPYVVCTSTCCAAPRELVSHMCIAERHYHTRTKNVILQKPYEIRSDGLM